MRDKKGLKPLDLAKSENVKGKLKAFSNTPVLTTGLSSGAFGLTPLSAGLSSAPSIRGTLYCLLMLA
jgi:hypothetical protein